MSAAEREARVRELMRKEKELMEEMRGIDRAPGRWVPDAVRAGESFDHARKKDLAELDRVRAELRELGSMPSEEMSSDEEGE